MIQTRMLSDLATRIGQWIGYARILVDGTWVTGKLAGWQTNGATVYMDFMLPVSGNVTTVQIYNVSGVLWDEWAEDIEVASGVGDSALIRVRYTLGEVSA